MIAVTGATGTIGSELVRLLAHEGVEVRALTRSPARAPELDGVRWVEADLSERGGRAEAFEGAERLFLLTGNTGDMVRLQTNAIRAAARAGVRHIVKLSALGATDHSKSVIGLWHYNVERALIESGVEWTLLRPHHFMQNLLDPLVFDRTAGQVFSSSRDGKIPFIDTRDIVAVAAVVLTGAGHQGETYTLTGPEARTYGEATELIAKALDRPVEYVPQTLDEAWVRRRDAGQPVWLAAAQLAIAEYQREGGPTERVTDTVQKLTGRAPRTLEAFVQDHLEELERDRTDCDEPSVSPTRDED